MKIRLTSQSFLIPRNYFSPFGKNSQDEKELDAFGFRLFLPNFEGYTPDNSEYYAWKSGKLEQFIEITQVREPVKFQIMNGNRVELPPTAWGEPNAMFALMSRSRELVREEYGLQCYGIKTPTGVFYELVCKGTRSNGEMMVMNCSEEVNAALYLCRGNYFSEKEKLHIRYAYSRHNLSQWKEIDDAIWNKIRAWRVN